MVNAIYVTPYSFTKKRRFLKTTVVIIPTIKPINIEPRTTSRNRNTKIPISEL
jgi:hypothetical protein